MRKSVLLVLFISYFFIAQNTFAASSYVLPYPSFMPGHPGYKVRLLSEKMQKYFYFGNVSRFKYNAKLSDRYLVESKILAEYGQYFLSYKALEKSNDFVLKEQISYREIKKKRLQVRDIDIQYVHQLEKHIEVLNVMKKTVPGNINWQEERSSVISLNYTDLIDKSIQTRKYD